MVTLLPVFVAVRRLGLVLGVLGVLAAAVACGGGGAPPRSLPPITSTTPAAVSTHAPAHTRAADLAAATAVVRRYYAEINGLSSAMDSSAIARLSTRSCTCRRFVRAIDENAAAGQRYFGKIRVIALTAALDTATVAEVLATYNSTAGGTRAADGSVLYKGKPHHGTIENFTLRMTNHGWLIDDIKLIHRGTTAR